MGRARQNPLGKAVPGATLVRVGAGEHTHIYGTLPSGEMSHLCQSGKNAGRRGGSGAVPELFKVRSAKFVTCYRCVKLAEVNQQAGRKAWEGA